jgi:hypothetical protein
LEAHDPPASPTRAIFASGKPRVIGLALLLLFVVIAPFPYGGIMPGGSATIEILAFLIAAAAILSTPPRERPFGGAWLPAAALLAIAVLGVIQLVPLAQGLLMLVSPASAEIQRDAAAVLSAAGAASIPPPRISIAPTETAGTILLVLAYLALFLSAVRLLYDRSSRRLLTAALVASAFVHLVVAVLVDAPADRVHGSFVNPNHFAAYLEIVLALAFGILWTEVLTGRDRAAGVVERAARIERRIGPLALRILLWGTLAAGIGLTRSRGGILAAGTTTIVLVALALLSGPGMRPRSWVRRGIVLGILGGAVFAVLAAGEGALLRFLSSDPREIGADFRVGLYRTSLRAFREFPLFGSGLGTFREAFLRVQPRDLPGLVEQAHCDGLQLLVTGGAIGAALGLAALASLFGLLAAGWRRQRRREESALLLAALGALLSVTLHGLVDFGLSVPAIPATLACVLGSAWAAARDPGGESPVRHSPRGG